MKKFLSYFKFIFKGVIFLMILTEKTRKKVKQAFSSIRDKFRFNQAKNEIEKIGEEDLQEVANSFKDVAINIVLDKFLGVNTNDIEEVYYANVQDDLDFLLESEKVKYELIEKYGLDDNLSSKQVFDIVQGMLDKNTQYIEYLNDNVSREKNGTQTVSKGVEENAQKEIVEESK